MFFYCTISFGFISAYTPWITNTTTHQSNNIGERTAGTQLYPTSEQHYWYVHNVYAYLWCSTSTTSTLYSKVIDFFTFDFYTIIFSFLQLKIYKCGSFMLSNWPTSLPIICFIFYDRVWNKFPTQVFRILELRYKKIYQVWDKAEHLPTCSICRKHK